MLVLLFFAIASALDSRINNITLISEYDAVEPGFRQLTPEEFKARVPSIPDQSGVNDNRGPLPQFPDFGISLQASDPDKQRRDREQKEKETETRKKQDELKKMQQDLKKRHDELKRQQDDFRKKQDEERKKREAEKKRLEEERLERERKREEEKPRRQLRPTEPNNNNNLIPVINRAEEKKPSPNVNRNVNRSGDEKKGKKDNEKKGEEKRKPKPANRRNQLPKRYEMPKNAGIKGKLGGKIPDPGIAISPEDRYIGSSHAYNLSPNLFQLAILSLLVLI